MARPKQETLTLFPEIVSITRKFSDAQFGALMRAAFAYRFGGETYSGDDPAVDVAFQTVAGQIDRYIEICKGNSQNAKGREREQNEAECSETKQNPPPIHSMSYPNLLRGHRLEGRAEPDEVMASSCPNLGKQGKVNCGTRRAGTLRLHPRAAGRPL